MSSIPDAEVFLAVDVGSVNTRASLFDIVDGRYRLVATSESNSTVGPPLFDLSEGVRIAMDRVQEITGRRMVDESEALIMPTTGYGAGIDLLVASISAGPPVRTILAGLMPGVSMASAKRLAESAYLKVVGEISIVDERRIEEQIDLIHSSIPDLILIVGGTDGGASDPLFQLVEVIKVAIGLLPEGRKPRVVFSGNRTLGALVVDRLADRCTVTITRNVRPDLEKEDLAPARLKLSETLHEIRSGRVTGYDELQLWTGGSLIPTAEAFGRLVRYLSKIYDPDKGVLGIDLGASHTTIAAGFEGQLNLSVNSELGAGTVITGILERGNMAEIMRWLPNAVSASAVRDYIYNKSLHPGSIPATIEDLHLEYAIVRQLIRSSLLDARKTWPEGKSIQSQFLLPQVEPIVVSGATLARAPKMAYTALLVLDAIQPTGVSTIVLDPYSLASAMGAAAGPLPMATVQLLEAGVLVSLGTVISAVGKGRVGRPVMAYRLEAEDGAPAVSGEVNFGQIAVLPLGQGKFGRLSIRPERGFEVGFGTPGRSGTLRVSGGRVGVIIDARGRPLALPEDPAKALDANQRWLWEIGALE
jgi:hypothetical protein